MDREINKEMDMKDVIKKLEAKHKHAVRNVDHYAEHENLAKTDEARAFYASEKNFWLGMASGLHGALAVVVQEELTGGTPF